MRWSKTFGFWDGNCDSAAADPRAGVLVDPDTGQGRKAEDLLSRR